MDKDLSLRRHKELVAEGWLRRFTAQEPRLSEMREFYESLGMEVLVEDGGVLDEDQECSSCLDLPGFSDSYKTIYTRGEAQSDADGSELFD
jgi:hypothetical protein